MPTSDENLFRTRPVWLDALLKLQRGYLIKTCVYKEIRNHLAPCFVANMEGIDTKREW